MPTQISQSALYSVQYNIPRIVLGKPGKQARALSGRLRISPGATEPIELSWGDSDGIPIGLVGLRAILLFWKTDPFQDGEFVDYTYSNIVTHVVVEVSDPHAGIGVAIISADQTKKISSAAREAAVRWGVYLMNSDEQIFPCVVGEGGARWGTVDIDRSGVPDFANLSKL